MPHPNKIHPCREYVYFVVPSMVMDGSDSVGFGLGYNIQLSYRYIQCPHLSHEYQNPQFHHHHHHHQHHHHDPFRQYDPSRHHRNIHNRCSDHRHVLDRRNNHSNLTCFCHYYCGVVMIKIVHNSISTVGWVIHIEWVVSLLLLHSLALTERRGPYRRHLHIVVVVVATFL